jgi:purine-binding chemotaxis protein CheW
MVLRGEVVEVVDLRRRLGLSGREPDRASRIVVVHGDEGRAAGLLVDAVLEVARVPEERVRPAEALETELVAELARRDDEFVSILDVERILELGDG